MIYVTKSRHWDEIQVEIAHLTHGTRGTQWKVREATISSFYDDV